MTNKSLGKVMAIVIAFVAIWIIAMIIGLVENKFRLVSKPKYGKKFLLLTSWILHTAGSLLYFICLHFLDKCNRENYFLVSGVVLYPFILALSFKLKGYFNQYYLKTPRKPIAVHLLSASAVLAFFIGLIILMILFKTAESNLFRLSIFLGYISIFFVLLILIPSQRNIEKSGRTYVAMEEVKGITKTKEEVP